MSGMNKPKKRKQPLIYSQISQNDDHWKMKVLLDPVAWFDQAVDHNSKTIFDDASDYIDDC